VARLALPAEASGDARALHPALLDMATGFAQDLVPGFDRERDFYVPLSYGRLTSFSPLPERLVSHVRLAETGPSVAVFDVTLLSEDGTPVVDVTGFTMKRVEDPTALTGAHERRRAPADPAARLFADVLSNGILEDEGMDALDRILAALPGATVVASPVDPLVWAAELGRPRRAEEPIPETRPNAAAPLAAREAPRTRLEERIAGVLQGLLGTPIGLHESFFDAGGHSLLLIRAVARIRQVTEADLPLASAFASPSVAGIAAAVEAARAEAPAAAASVVVPLSRDAYRVKRSEIGG
jgi:hypothetical protein